MGQLMYHVWLQEEALIPLVSETNIHGSYSKVSISHQCIHGLYASEQVF